jgi:small subunit ribosomal protein S21
MIIIEIEGKDSLEKALKKYKKKYEKTGVLKKLRSRKEYVKPSEKRRDEIKKAIYVQQKISREE